MDNGLQTYIEALEKMSTDPTEIDQLRNSNPLALFAFGCQTLLSETITTEMATAALASISRIFVPSVINTVESLKEMFNCYDEETKEMIMTALIRGLLMPDESTRNQASYTLSNVFRLNVKEWGDFFERLNALMRHSDADERNFAGVMAAYKKSWKLFKVLLNHSKQLFCLKRRHVCDF